MKLQTCLAALAATVNTCGAFVPSLGSYQDGVRASHAHHRPSSASPLRSSSSSPADAVDAFPSDVSPNASSPTPPASGGFSLANELLQTVLSGVGEGYIPYSEADKSAIEELVVELETSPGQGTEVQFPRDLGKLDGRWRLVFTNNLVGLGKLSPVELRDVYQVVDSAAGLVSNVVYATMSPPLFSETWGRLGERAAEIARTVEDRVTFPVDFNIQHEFEVSSQSKPAQVKI
ncbi:unnamed protein product, partial [Ectocarpus sp. 4 AP-2014]